MYVFFTWGWKQIVFFFWGGGGGRAETEKIQIEQPIKLHSEMRRPNSQQLITEIWEMKLKHTLVSETESELINKYLEIIAGYGQASAACGIWNEIITTEDETI